LIKSGLKNIGKENETRLGSSKDSIGNMKAV